MSKLDGVWRNIYDEKALNDRFTCQLMRIMQADDGDFEEEPD